MSRNVLVGELSSDHGLGENLEKAKKARGTWGQSRW